MIKPILVHPNSVLRQTARRVELFDDSLKQLITDLSDTVIENKGLGLSAIQVGDLSDVIVVIDQKTKEPLPMINAKITYKSPASIYDLEGCLSLPGEIVEVSRSVEIDVNYQTIFGEMIDMTFTGLMARIIQHEIDHNRGKLIIDFK